MATSFVKANNRIRPDRWLTFARRGRRTRAIRRFAAAVASLVAAVPAAADHGGPLRNAPMSPLTAALLFAGLALLVGAIVIVVVRVLTKER